MKQKLLVLVCVFLLTFLSGYGQTHSVYKELQHRKSSVETLNFTEPFLLPSDSKKLENDFKKVLFDVNDIQLFEYKTTDLFNKEVRGVVKFKIPYGKQVFDIEAFESSEGLEDLVVTTGKGSEVKVDLKVKVFKGVLANDEKSLVSLTFFNDEISGFISSPSLGDYNVEKLSQSNLIAIYPTENLSIKNNFVCGVVDDEKEQNKEVFVQSNYAAVPTLNKCVRLFFETRYDIYEQKHSVLEVIKFVTILYTQTETIYYNEGIQTKFSGLIVWDVPDPYGIKYQETEPLLPKFRSYRTSFNGDLGQLLTFETSGGRAYLDKLCKSGAVGVSGVHNSVDNIFPNYSWNGSVISHEFGHSLGSNHTHGCYWGPNRNTVVDGCGQTADITKYNENCGSRGYNFINYVPPLHGGTIMSYCHLLSNVQISFSNGFGPEPGDLIRSRVARASCLQSCNYCPEDSTVIREVGAGTYERLKTVNSLIAQNIILGNAIYTAGNEVVLQPGFHAKEGAYFNAYIANCVGENYLISTTDLADSSNKPPVEEDKATKKLTIHPNPTTGTFYISYPYNGVNTYYVEIYDIKGKKVLEQKLTKENNKVFLQQSYKGVYSIRFYENNQVILDKIILK
ncbi:zinc-dependent metalloprotease [Flavobacterium sp. NKUCC04_CG]|uniref:zinc-dependent metalloprotease n=1 Tax=Flavobacterium sp. NKUCC04_CG TaxID=2842121 RepID=UPI001C5AFD63|nr:zinc-dependent metalloprotease [Flavobacterium sp. NKUCC04_CG]MBW3518028.1 T9SS type A sorting domain-containing protein [Flavobacterium sp. NKUCC04_CG]